MDDKYKKGLEKLAQEQKLYPQEQLMKVRERNKSLFIGIPKEISRQENRVSLTPDAVALLVNNGHEVWVESGAGNTSKFFDNDYSDCGARIVYSTKEALEAQIILKVEPPGRKEIEYMKPGSALISAVQIGDQTAEYLNALNKKRITAIG